LWAPCSTKIQKLNALFFFIAQRSNPTLAPENESWIASLRSP